MKIHVIDRTIDLTKEDLSPSELEIILNWKNRKYEDRIPLLTVGQCLELLVALTYNYHKDFSDSRFFNNIIINQESVLAWDGGFLIDTIFYEIKSLLHKRLSQAKILD